MKIKNVLLTGSTGYLGKNFRESAVKHHNIYDYNRGEKLNKYNFPPVDVVVHIAGARTKDGYFNMIKSNVFLTRRLVKWANKTNAKKIVYASTWVVTKDRKGIYGYTKLMAENLIRNYFNGQVHIERLPKITDDNIGEICETLEKELEIK